MIAPKSKKPLTEMTAAEARDLLPEILTSDEVAELLGITPVRVRQLCQAGDMGRKFGVVWAISRSEVMRYVKRAVRQDRKGMRGPRRKVGAPE